jgi:tetratricopeptide (TPR) repeat protein
MTKRIAITVILMVIFGIFAFKGHFFKEKKDYSSMVQLGIEYQDKGEKKKALQLFKDAAKAYPDYPQAHFLLGRSYFMMQKEDEAVAEFRFFMDTMKEFPPVKAEGIKWYIQCLHYISDTCSGLKRYDEMKSAISDIIALDPNDQGAYYNFGVYYYNAEHNRPEAYQKFKKAFDLDPNTSAGKRAKYAIEFMRNNPDARVAPDLSFIDQEYK